MNHSLPIPPERLIEDARWLRAIALHLAGPDDADDLAQEAWLQALEQPPGRIRGLRPWLTTVVRHALDRVHGSDAARTRREHAASRPDEVPSPADLEAWASLHRTVVDAVLSLDEPFRSTILLRFFDDRRPREIARLHGVPVETVRSRLRRALATLRTRLDREFGNRESWVLAAAPGLLRRSAGTASVVGGSAAAASLLAGVFTMSVKAKIVVAAGALLLVASGIGVTWRAWDRESAKAHSLPSSVEEHAAPVGRSSSRASTPPAFAAIPQAAARPATLPQTAGARPVAVRVIVKNTAAPIGGASILRVADPLAPPAANGARVLTNAEGVATLDDSGWYAFSASGFCPRVARVPQQEGSEPFPVALKAAGSASIRLVTVTKDVLPGITVRAYTRRRLLNEPPSIVAGPRAAADAGLVCDAVSDVQGVARFEGMAEGSGTLEVLNGDYVFDDRSSFSMTISGEVGSPADVILRPLAVGVVMVEGLPPGTSAMLRPALPEGFQDYPSFAVHGPSDCFVGQMAQVRKRLEEAAGKATTPRNGRMMFVTATRTARAAADEKTTWPARLFWRGVEVATVDVPVRSPSSWEAGNCAHLRLSRDRLGPLTEVRVHFEGEPTAGVSAWCPAMLEGTTDKWSALGTHFSIPPDDHQEPGPVTLLVPPGSYDLRPDLMCPWEWKLAATFDPMTVLVGESPLDVTLRPNHPISLVQLDVRDEFGRRLTRYWLQAKPFGPVYTGDVPVIPVDGDSWEFAISGVADAGYLGVPKHTQQLLRGQLNIVTCTLQPKE